MSSEDERLELKFKQLEEVNMSNAKNMKQICEGLLNDVFEASCSSQMNLIMKKTFYLDFKI